MLQVNFIRQNVELVRERLAVKNFKQLELVDEIVLLDETRKKLQTRLDETQSKINSTSKEIGRLMAQGQKQEAESKKVDVASLKQELEPISIELTGVEKSLQDACCSLFPAFTKRVLRTGRCR